MKYEVKELENPEIISARPKGEPLDLPEDAEILEHKVLENGDRWYRWKSNFKTKMGCISFTDEELKERLK